MDPHALEILEFDKIRQLLAGQAASALGVEAARSLLPETEPLSLRRRLQETGEARTVFDAGEDIPLAGLHDLREIIRRAAIGGVLTGPELHLAAQTLRCIENVRRFFTSRDHLPVLGDLAAQLLPRPGLADAIEACIGDDGEVVDDASAELRRLRRLVRTLASRVQSTLRGILGQLAGDPALQESVVTIREGRYCVPIKSGFQNRFEGIIHDRSASGQTVFMEPASVVRVNNELRDAQLAERDEVVGILTALSEQLGHEAETFDQNLHLMTRLDLARAKGKLSVRLRASAPELDADGRLELKEARHPLLVVGATAEHPVVPIDVRLGGDWTVLLVTGPNTGGKTVALKTVGLLTLMAHAGLHIPAEPGSRVGLHGQVFADIGDEQSIEQSLSTFGSHLRQIVRILDAAGPGDLVLLDELGAGTDPTEGAALAEAVMTVLHRRGCRVLATTHHGTLKAFAYATEGVENGSVSFDAKSLAPTYELLIGIPGASHAFAIAAGLGLSEEVLELARELLPEEHHEASTMIGSMQVAQQRLEGELRDAQRDAATASHQRRELERERKRLRELESELRQEARREAGRLLEQVRGEADAILSELRRAEREGKQTEVARKRLRQLGELIAAPAASTVSQPKPPPGWQPLPGDVVQVNRLGREGTVLEGDPEGDLQVQVGPMRMTVGRDDISLVRKGEPPKAPAGRRDVELSLGIEDELHVRGQTVDEALANVDRYLDHAMLAGLHEVRIVHGKGTGTLRNAVWQYLRDHPQIERWQHPPEHQGGRGVTVAWFHAV